MNIYSSSPRPNGHDEAVPAANEFKFRQDVASYVVAMLAELRQIAGKAGFDKLVKSLDTAYYDAYGALDAKACEAAAAPSRDAGEAIQQKASPTPDESRNAQPSKTTEIL